MRNVATFPFGQPVRPLRQIDQSPKEYFVLGVYASAVHARCVNSRGKTVVRALAVASEPYIFWRGEDAQKVISRIKGGMIVDIGVKAFLPGSQIDLTPVRDLDGLVGKTFNFKIIKINHRRGNVVVSRRALLEETRDKRRQTTIV